MQLVFCVFPAMTNQNLDAKNQPFGVTYKPSSYQYHSKWEASWDHVGGNLDSQDGTKLGQVDGQFFHHAPFQYEMALCRLRGVGVVRKYVCECYGLDKTCVWVVTLYIGIVL